MLSAAAAFKNLMAFQASDDELPTVTK